jgi:hypothetical protein
MRHARPPEEFGRAAPRSVVREPDNDAAGSNGAAVS